MKKRFIFVSVIVVSVFIVLGFSRLVTSSKAASEAGETNTGPVMGMPVPDQEDVDEMIVGEDNQTGASMGMPVPGLEGAGVDEMVISGDDNSGSASMGMPVPGMEGVEETIVNQE